MSYSIHITATAERDILRAADYIEFTLKNPTAAEHLRRLLRISAIASENGRVLSEEYHSYPL